MKTINYFRNHGFPDLTQEELEEAYSPNVYTKDMEDGEYLSKHRIELDSVLTKVGAKALWKYVKYQLLETFSEGRDYNRVISNPKPTHYNGNSFPYAINVIFHYLEGLYGTITADKWAKVEKDLEAVTGELYDIDDKIEELKADEIRPVMIKNKHIKLIIKKFVEIAEIIRLGKLPSLEKLKEENQQQQLEVQYRQQQRQQNYENE